MIEGKLEGEELVPSSSREGSSGEGSSGEKGDIPRQAEGEQPAAPEESLVPLEPGELRKATEAVLFSVSEPISIRTLSELFGVSVHDVREAVEELRLEYVDGGRAFRVEDIAGGVQILTLSRYAPWVRKLRQKEREGRLSAAALETLAVIAYKQPIHRADLESIRGVNCGPILKTLLDRGLIQVVGRDEGLGKPLLYGTTKRFLESFGLASVRDLPQPEMDLKPTEAPAQPTGEGPSEAAGASQEDGQAPGSAVSPVENP
jgi:segregation and condensation protein B